MQTPVENNPNRRHHAQRGKWIGFLALASCLLLPAKSLATAGDPIPGVDVSLEQIPGGIAAGFTGTMRFGALVGDFIELTATNALFTPTNTASRVTAGRVPGGQFVITQETSNNIPLALTGRPHLPVGVATVSVSSNRVLVSNLGSSGQDGVVVSDPQMGGGSFALRYQPVNLSDAGAQMAFATVGDVNGSSNVVAKSLSFSNSAPGRLRMRSNFSGIGASQLVVSVYRAGALVGSTLMNDGDLGDAAPAMELNCAADKSWPAVTRGVLIRRPSSPTPAAART